LTAPRVLVLGASGMLGHEAVRVLAPDFEVWGACRNPAQLPDLGVPPYRMLGGLDAASEASADALVDTVRPDVIINAAGIVKQRRAAKDARASITVNSLWPHVVADAAGRYRARLVHISTDCVFSGAHGMYKESDVPDDPELYGRSKLLGEVVDRDDAVTLRTSIIGWQLGQPTGLVGWFAAHRTEPIKGFRKAVFSGLTTRRLTEVIRDVVIPDGSLAGLWHVSADPIDKYGLLSQLAGHLGWAVDLTPVDEPLIDRSLDSTRFRERTGWRPPSWAEMLKELAAEYELQ
jgi:dTDP-4-dehydrorhamnose reductase